MAIPNIQEIDVGLNGKLGFKVIKMKQYDKNTRTIEITLIEDGSIVEIPSTYVAKFQATKKDNTVVFDDCTITGNVISYTVIEQLTTVVGEVSCEIGLYEPDALGDTTKDKLIQSATFKILVEKSAMDRNAVVSSNEFNTLTIMINTLTGLVESVTTTINNANTLITNLNNETLIIWKPYVNTYTDISTTYPTPALGWATQAKDTGIRWRYNGVAWTNIGIDSTDKIGDITQLPTADKTNVVNSIKEIKTDIGDMTLLSNTDLVGAVNEVNTKIDNITKLINPTMDTSEIQTLLNNGGLFKFLNGDYQLTFNSIAHSSSRLGDIPTCLIIPSNCHIELEDDVVLNCPANSEVNYIILAINDKDNVSIKGGCVNGDLLTHIGTTGEWGYGVHIDNSNNVDISIKTVQHCWGDGYIVTGESTNVKITNSVSTTNRRQNMTIGLVEGLYVDKSKFVDAGKTSGTNPKAGVDIEPDFYGKLNRVFFSKCEFNGSGGSGFEVNLKQMVNNTTNSDFLDVTLDDCVFNDNARGFAYSLSNAIPMGHLDGLIKVRNCKFNNNAIPIYLPNLPSNVIPQLEVENIEIDTWSDYSYGIHCYADNANDGSGVGNVVEYGGFKFKNVKLIGFPALPPTPATTCLFNATGYRKINLEIDGFTSDQTDLSKWIFWNSGNGKVDLKQLINSFLNAGNKSYAYLNGVNTTYSIDNTFTLPSAALCKGREFTLVHNGLYDIIRFATTGSDTIVGLNSLVAGLSNVLTTNGTKITFKSNGVSEWRVINFIGNAKPLEFRGIRKQVFGAAIPTTGTWYQGDTIFNSTPAAGGYAGWICVTSGTPGAWKGYGLIAT